MPSTNGINTNNLITTMGNSQTTILSREVAEKTSGYFTVNVVCRRLSDGATKAFVFSGSHKRMTGSPEVNTETLTLIGTNGDILALLLAGVVADISGNEVRIRVTGLSSTTMIWYAEIVGNEIVDD